MFRVHHFRWRVVIKEIVREGDVCLCPMDQGAHVRTFSIFLSRPCLLVSLHNLFSFVLLLSVFVFLVMLLQFLSADGKGQKELLPVLDTLLKLSPQEKQFIEKAAAGKQWPEAY